MRRGPAARRSLTPGRRVDAAVGRGGTALAATLTAALVGGPGAAQEPGTDPTVLAPLRVEGAAERGTGPVGGWVAERSTTGSKTDTPLIENPQSVSVISRERMDDQGVRTVGEALRYTPGVQAEPFGTDSRVDWFVIRGFQQNETGLFRDNLRLRSTGFASWQVDPYGLERVEVIRGPNSVLYGQIAPGGLVNLVSKRAPEEPLREVGVAVGSRSKRELTLDVGGPADEAGRALFRMTALGRLADTQVDYVDEDRLYLAPTVTLRPRDGTELTLLASYQRDRTGAETNFLPSQGTFRYNPNGDISTTLFTSEPDFDKYNKDQHALGYAFEQEVGSNLTLRQNFRYDRLDLDYRAIFGQGLQEDLRTLNRGSISDEADTNAFAIDNQGQLDNEFGPLRSTVLFGIDATRSVYDQEQASGAAPPLDVFDPDYGAPVPDPAVTIDTDTTLDQLGIYAQEQAKLWDRLVVTLGGRYDWTYTSIDDDLAGQKTQQDDEKLTWRAGLAWLFDSGLAPYASYATSFNPTLGTDVAGDPYQPDNGEQVEVGIKYQPPGVDAFLTLSAFDLTRENVLTTDPVDPTNQIQTGEVNVRGIEVEGVASPLPGLDLVASYSYLDAEIEEGAAGEEGNRPNAVPAHLASAWASYELQSGPLAGLGAGAGMRYVGNQEVDNLNTDQVPDRLLVDMGAHYDIGGARLALNVANLLDDTYVTSCANSVAFCYYGERRSITASLRLRW